MHSGSRINPFVNRKPLIGGNGREAFLARVRKGLGHAEAASPAPSEAPPVRDEALVRQVAKNDPRRVERFAEKAKGNSMVVHRVAADGVLAAIDQCFANHTIASSVVNGRELEERFGVAQHLVDKGVKVVRWGEADCREAAFHCDASVTDCRAGLADTGALLVWSDAGFGRSSTLVVPVHVVLVPESRVLADMMDGFDLVLRENNGVMPSNVVVINGPSKTGDIEMKLVTGVHGPKYVYVVLIAGL